MRDEWRGRGGCSFDRAEQVEQRRRAFALFLDQLEGDPKVASDDRSFRRGTIDAFHSGPGRSRRKAEADASWGALAMKECVQDAICCWVTLSPEPVNEADRIAQDRLRATEQAAAAEAEEKAGTSSPEKLLLKRR